MTLSDLNSVPLEIAAAELRRCCGSTAWAGEMARRRPFETLDEMAGAADAVWTSLPPEEWRQAFAAHPRIGERGGSWSSAEQSGMNTAADAVRRRLAAGNREYEARFGYIFIVCASGRTADEMLAVLERRLLNDPSEEVHVAADEQRKIMRLRLAKLVGD